MSRDRRLKAKTQKPAKPKASSVSPGPWEPWFDEDEEGFIAAAGVDTKGRNARIAERKRTRGVTEVLSETIEFDDKDRFNARMRGDTAVLASAWSSWKRLERLVRDDARPLTVTEAHSVFRVREGRPEEPGPH